MRKGQKNYKYYREGYNNPSNFNQDILLKCNNDVAQTVIKGILDRKKDEMNGCVEFKR